MSLFKRVQIGAAAAAGAVLLWVVAKAALSLTMGAGAGSIGVVISDLDIVLAAVAGYCVGFFLWQRRSQRPK